VIKLKDKIELLRDFFYFEGTDKEFLEHLKEHKALIDKTYKRKNKHADR
jgi:hypothetical protein